ncbi:GIY-YIG nuclease family protein [Actinomadura sediminis]|uniref:GIY-YIG nuclease family protein n=1 Tax=Actinomadura sediminis TaxID=1038904 RepID=A0ABW3ERE9_9ACTN
MDPLLNYRPGRSGSRHPIVNQILEEFDPDTPGVAGGLLRLRKLKEYGAEITIDVARACIRESIARAEIIDRVRKKRDERAQSPLVYYMRLGDLVKIGWTTNLKSRREAINPQEVMATEPGNDKVERQRHKQFADLRVHGEWFRLESPLTEWIDQLKAAYGEEKDVDDRDMISTKDATKIYGVPYSKLRLWANEGRICEPERRGRELFWDAAEIEQIKDILGDRKHFPRGRTCGRLQTQV